MNNLVPDTRPRAEDFATVGAFAEALIEHLMRKQFEELERKLREAGKL